MLFSAFPLGIQCFYLCEYITLVYFSLDYITLAFSHFHVSLTFSSQTQFEA